MSARLVARELTVKVKSKALLSSVSLEVRPGEVLAIVGPNGAGKSTLLGALAGDLRPSGGEVSFDGVSLSRMSSLALARRRAVVRQRSELAAELTVAEVVALGDVTPRGAAARHVAVMAQLRVVGLDRFADRKYPTLSGGERARVHLARALVQLGPGRDTALLLDEPTAALDPQQQHRIGKILREVAGRGVAVAVILHDLLLASCYADRVAVLAGGELLTCAATTEALAPSVLRRAFDVEFELVELQGGGRAPIAHPSVQPAPAIAG
jgi:iron complex transport system ATP-binding protein